MPSSEPPFKHAFFENVAAASERTPFGAVLTILLRAHLMIQLEILARQLVALLR